MANRSEAFDGAESGPRPGDFGCAGDDLKDMLATLSRQFFEADQRNVTTLAEMRGRLETLGRTTESVRDQVPPQYAPAFARIEDGVHLLAEQIAAIGREREIARATAALTSAFEEPAPAAVQAAAFVAPAAAPTLQPAPVVAVAATEQALPQPKAAPVAEASIAGDAAEPWDRQSAEALANLYDSGNASFGGMPHETPVAPKAAVVQEHRVPAAVPLAAAIDTADRDWLESRFAEIAGKVEHSLSQMRPEHALAAFDHRIDELEQRLGAAFENVATRADVEGLRIVEAHINELANQFDQARSHFERLDSIERQVGDLMHQVSDERFSQLFGQINQAPAPQGPSEEDIEAVAMAVADRVASRLPEPSLAVAAAPSVDGATIADLKRVVEGFVSGQRETEEHTATMLDTMQQAMIRMLDRMDAIESAAPAYGSHGATFAPAAAPSSAPVESAMAAGNRAEPTFAAAAAAPAAAAPAKEDFRAAAIADARRAARKVASHGEAGDASVAAAATGPRARRGAPGAEVPAVAPETAGDKKPRSKLPMMVAGIALIAAVGFLAASVGFKSSTPGTSVQQAQRKAPLSIDNGSMETSSDTMPTAPAKSGGAAPQHDQNPIQSAPSTKPADGAGQIPRTQSALEGETQTEMVVVPQQASLTAQPARPPVAPMGVSVTQTNAPPAGSDLARMRRERNMASLASQLAAVQANAPALPASMMQTASTAPQAEEAQAEVANGPALPVTIGPNSLRVAAQKGDPSAEFEVAARFAEGRGVAQDFKQATVWYSRSAQRGFAPAQYRLGTLFERGIGAKPDVARARIWYGRAADQGHVKAMHNLAVLNAGNEAGSDYAAAVQWFTAAAERGLADSQYNLGVLYESGLGMNRDMKLAYQWLSLAARTGDKEAARRRDQIRMKLEESEVSAIDQIVSNWQAKAVDGNINEARAAGEAWKQRQAAR